MMVHHVLLLLSIASVVVVKSQPSVNACNNKSENDECSFTKMNGEVVVGICVSGTCTECSQEQNCPNDQTGAGYQGKAECIHISKPAAAPSRGSIACLTPDALARRPTAGNQNLDAVNIYGPMENGFTSQNFACLNSETISGGHDTKLAEQMVMAISSCVGQTLVVLDSCGGHANPYHYHEKMECLYESDSTTGHSTRVGTALDGNGIYGMYIDGGELPCDLDACGGRTGVTPDSNGQEVYYYMITNYAPFTLGCFGLKDHFTTVEECRALYPDECSSSSVVSVTTLSGTGNYALDCPCFDTSGSNTDTNTNIPGYLSSEEIALLPVSRCATADTSTVAPTTSTEVATTEYNPTSESTTEDGGDSRESSSDDDNVFIYVAAGVGGVVGFVVLVFMFFSCVKAQTYAKN